MRCFPGVYSVEDGPDECVDRGSGGVHPGPFLDALVEASDAKV